MAEEVRAEMVANVLAVSVVEGEVIREGDIIAVIDTGGSS